MRSDKDPMITDQISDECKVAAKYESEFKLHHCLVVFSRFLYERFHIQTNEIYQYNLAFWNHLFIFVYCSNLPT